MSVTSTKSIEGITFAVWSHQEIRKYSVVEITQPETYDEDGMAVQGGLMDGRLGVLEPGQKCLTDGNTAARSPGHFGHIELAEPVLHIAFVDNIYKLLQSTCRTCGRIKMSPEDIKEFSKIKERQASYTVLSQKRIPDQIQEKAKKQKDCPHCGKSQYELIFTKPTTFVEKTEIGENRLLPITIRERLSIIPDEETAARIAEMVAPIEEMKKKVVAKAASDIDGDRANCRVRECQMGNLVADAMLERVSSQGVEIAIQNGGGLRASIGSGNVTMGDVLTVLPFQNTLSTFEVTGETIIAALENGVSQMEEVKGRFPQVAGLSFAVNPSAEVGSRISKVFVGGSPIDRGKTYKVVSNNYVRNGGDGYKMFRGASNAYDYGPDLADVTAEFLAKQNG